MAFAFGIAMLPDARTFLWRNTGNGRSLANGFVALAFVIGFVARYLFDRLFDVIQQGMGPDAHTASLFPGEPLVMDQKGLTAAVYVEKLKAARITLLPGVLARARHTLMLVTGADKAPALHTVWLGPEAVLEAPAQLTRQHQGAVTWFLDEAAAVGIR